MTPAIEINKLKEIEKPMARWRSPKPKLVTIIAYLVDVKSLRAESMMPLQITSSTTALISEKNKQNSNSDWISPPSF